MSQAGLHSCLASQSGLLEPAWYVGMPGHLVGPTRLATLQDGVVNIFICRIWSDQKLESVRSP